MKRPLSLTHTTQLSIAARLIIHRKICKHAALTYHGRYDRPRRHPPQRAALRSLIPPPRLQLSKWIEANIRLPEGVSALPRV
jgi:hypothetical protein